MVELEDTAPLVEAAPPLLLVWWGWSRSRLLRCMDIVLLGATARCSAASVARLRSLMLWLWWRLDMRPWPPLMAVCRTVLVILSAATFVYLQRCNAMYRDGDTVLKC